MASDLYPTKTRLALLEDVRDGLVYEESLPGGRYVRSAPTGYVTARVIEMLRAGWVEQRSAPGDKWRKQMRLTAEGERILAEHTEPSDGQ
jgi:hypothetical protein